MQTRLRAGSRLWTLGPAQDNSKIDMIDIETINTIE